jgi:hypothetical protein
MKQATIKIKTNILSAKSAKKEDDAIFIAVSKSNKTNIEPVHVRNGEIYAPILGFLDDMWDYIGPIDAEIRK